MSKDEPQIPAELVEAKAKAEIDKALAEIEKTKVDIEKTKQEIAETKAQTRIHTATAAKTEAEARLAEILASEKTRTEQAELAKDDHNHVYRFTDSVGAQSVKACVEKLTRWHRQNPQCDIEVIFTSPGGSIIDGFVLFDFLRQLSREGHRITTGCLGWAASMAGILLQAGDHRWVGSEGWVMIHRAAFGAQGKTFDVEDEVEWVKRIEKRIIAIFESRTGGVLTSTKIKRNWDRKDWWIDSSEALELNLVDEVR